TPARADPGGGAAARAAHPGRAHVRPGPGTPAGLPQRHPQVRGRRGCDGHHVVAPAARNRAGRGPGGFHAGRAHRARKRPGRAERSVAAHPGHLPGRPAGRLGPVARRPPGGGRRPPAYPPLQCRGRRDGPAEDPQSVRGRGHRAKFGRAVLRNGPAGGGEAMSGAVRALLFKELREGRWKYLIAAVVLVALGVSIPVTHQFIAGMLEQFMDDPAVPQALRDLLPPDLLEMSTYLWTNWHAKNLYQTVAVIALVFGSGAVAGEFSRGTAPYLFSRAVVRRSVLAVKTAVDLAGMALAMLLGTAALDVTARIAHGYAVSGAFYAGLVPALA